MLKNVSKQDILEKVLVVTESDAPLTCHYPIELMGIPTCPKGLETIYLTSRTQLPSSRTRAEEVIQS